MGWLRRSCLVVALVVGAAGPAAVVTAAPPPNPPDGPTTQGFYSLVSEYKGDVPAVRGWQITWQVPQLNNGSQAWGAIGQWYANLESGVYHTPGEGWWVYYYGDDDGLTGNNSGCTVSWETGGHCHGVMENLAVGRQVTFVYEWCTAGHVPDVDGTKLCVWVDMNDGAGNRFLASDTPPAGNREMYAHDIETFGDSNIVEPIVSCSRPIVMAGQRVKGTDGGWTTLTGDFWTWHDATSGYEFRNVDTTATPARWESCSSGRKVDTVGVFRPSDRKAYLRTSLSAGNNDVPGFVATTDAAQVPVTGDWDGDGVDSVGYYQPSDLTFHLRNPLDAGGGFDRTFSAARFAAAGDLIVVGDWDGDGKDGVGTVRPGDRTARLRNELSDGDPSVPVFTVGTAGDVPVAGDWNGDGRDSLGFFRPSTGNFHLRNGFSGASDYTVDHATVQSGDTPLVGDWNGDGIDTVGVYRPGERRFYLFAANTNTATVLTPFAYGLAGDRPLVGDWRIDAAEPTVAQIANAYGFYVDPASNPAAWVAANPSDPRAAGIRASIANRPMARWFGTWTGDVSTAVSSYVTAASALGPVGKVPVLVASGIAGCAASTPAEDAAYRAWIDAFTTGLGNRPAVVVLEPNALPDLDCLPTDAARGTRLDLLRYAATQLHQRSPRAWVYLDAGNPGWIAADTMAQRLDGAGLRTVRGFAVNTTSFYTTTESTTYATAIDAALQARYGYIARFVVDTSRNGNGATAEWCNPAGRRLGAPADVVEEPRPGNTPRSRMADLLLWVKAPGDSDGRCGTAPDTDAGVFDPALAVNLINGT